MASGYSYSLYSVSFPQEYILHAEINRPQVLNAFSRELMGQTSSLFLQANADPNVRAVILSAQGKAFSSGLDLKDTQTSSLFTSSGADPARTAKALSQVVKQSQECTNSIANCTKPVICVLHGPAVGIAIDIASACDIRIAAQDAKLSIKEVDIGIAADLGTLQRFPRLVANDSWTRELALTARFFGAKEALDKGFVSYVCESKDKGVEKAVEIAEIVVSKSPVAVQGTKALLDYSRDHSVKEALEYTQLWSAVYMQTSDMKESIDSFFTKRKPRFAKL